MTIRDLIKSALRMRPDRIIVGEVRGDETVDMISSAMLNGHSGSMSTGHANNPMDMLHRLETMMLMGIELPLIAIQQQIASALDVIIHLGRLRDKSRKVLEITEVLGYENGRIQLQTLYKFQEEGMEDGKIKGTLMKENEITQREKLLAAGKDFRSLANLKFAVVGEGTAKALAGKGFLADFVPTKYTSRTLAKEWVPTLQKDERVVLVRAEEASKELDQALDAAGIAYSKVSMYHTAVDLRKAEELRRMISQVDYVTLCSGSAVRAFASMLEEDGVRVDCPAKIICIGPVTEKTAEAAGLAVGQSAVEYTAEGIRNVLLADVKAGK